MMSLNGIAQVSIRQYWSLNSRPLDLGSERLITLRMHTKLQCTGLLGKYVYSGACRIIMYVINASQSYRLEWNRPGIEYYDQQ